MTLSIAACLDELEKISVALTGEEKRRQAMQFAGLGAVSAPIIGGAKNYLTYGKVAPWQTGEGLLSAGGKGRFLAGSMLAGAAAGGLMPTIRHNLERGIQDQARARRRRELAANAR